MDWAASWCRCSYTVRCISVVLKLLLKASAYASAVFAAVATSSAHALPLVLNADFETPILPSGQGDQYAVKLPNVTTGLEWTGSGPSGVEIWRSGFNGLNAYQGNQFAEVQNNDLLDSISQIRYHLTMNVIPF